ncbi:MAG: hypothetical protein M3072_14715 [Candidatus Dormibacteraeota bacterium]|nr:hypothetical protein [Candidatus Dormibacteraeota bacterium]
MLNWGSILLRSLLAWAPIAVAALAIGGLAYAVGQQSIRAGADDPQIQLAHDTAQRLNQAPEPVRSAAAAQPAVDLRQTLDPYVILYDGNGRPVSQTVRLDGATPAPPTGAFAAATGRGENRITWQPAPGVRSAAVIVPYRDGYVLAGRSLSLAEERERSLAQLTVLSVLVTLLATAATCLAATWLLTRWPARPSRQR